MSAPFLCELRADHERAVVVPHGGLDATTFPRLEEQIERLCDAGFPTILLDLSAPGAVDPAGLALLSRIDALAGRHQVALMLDLQRTDAALLLEA